MPPAGRDAYHATEIPTSLSGLDDLPSPLGISHMLRNSALQGPWCSTPMPVMPSGEWRLL